MRRDLRDPQKLGEAILYLRKYPARRVGGEPLSVLCDRHFQTLHEIPDYSANPSCIDKYGRPQDVKPVWQEIKVV